MMNFQSKPPKPTDEKSMEIINARVPDGTFERIDKVLKGGEVRSAFLRAALEAELKRREKKASRA